MVYAFGCMHNANFAFTLFTLHIISLRYAPDVGNPKINYIYSLVQSWFTKSFDANRKFGKSIFCSFEKRPHFNWCCSKCKSMHCNQRFLSSKPIVLVPSKSCLDFVCLCMKPHCLFVLCSGEFINLWVWWLIDWLIDRSITSSICVFYVTRDEKCVCIWKTCFKMSTKYLLQK